MLIDIDDPPPPPPPTTDNAAKEEGDGKNIHTYALVKVIER